MDGNVRGNQDELQIAAEWKRRFRLQASPAEIESYLFGSLSPEQVADNPFFKEVQKNSWLSDYFGYASECGVVIFCPDPWESINTDSVATGARHLIPKGLSILAKQVDPFWQKKYAFQVLRLAFYQQETDVFNRLYNTYFGFGREKTPMDCGPRITNRWYWKTDVDSANFCMRWYSATVPTKCLCPWQWYSSRNFEATKRMACNDSDLADLYVMKAMINPGKVLDDVREVVRYNKNHPLLPLLLLREMNKPKIGSAPAATAANGRGRKMCLVWPTIITTCGPFINLCRPCPFLPTTRMRSISSVRTWL